MKYNHELAMKLQEKRIRQDEREKCEKEEAENVVKSGKQGYDLGKQETLRKIKEMKKERCVCDKELNPCIPCDEFNFILKKLEEGEKI